MMDLLDIVIWPLVVFASVCVICHIGIRINCTNHKRHGT